MWREIEKIQVFQTQNRNRNKIENISLILSFLLPTSTSKIHLPLSIVPSPRKRHACTYKRHKHRDNVYASVRCSFRSRIGREIGEWPSKQFMPVGARHVRRALSSRNLLADKTPVSHRPGWRREPRAEESKDVT